MIAAAEASYDQAGSSIPLGSLGQPLPFLSSLDPLSSLRLSTFPSPSIPMLISLQGAEWHGTRLHTGLMCAGVNCFYPLCSPLRGSWKPGHPSHQTTSRESSIQRRRSCGVEQFAAGHSYCINSNTVYFQKSAQD